MARGADKKGSKRGRAAARGAGPASAAGRGKTASESARHAPGTGKLVRHQQGPPFRIVGMGASAGGLEAFEQFFTRVPVDSGLAFVIVQHLDPAHHSAMPEILRRLTKIPTREATDGMRVEPNGIYLIPPNRDMVIERKALRLEEPSKIPGLRLPIDLFFRSLAREEGPEAICIIFSGTGTDGTLGLRAVKAELGTVFVQDPKTARYDGMPISAINTGLADFVLPPDKMPQQLIEFVRHSAANGARSGKEADERQEPLQQIFATLRVKTGHDFSRYKATTIRRRLQRRMSVNQMDDVSTYSQLLRDSPEEVKALIKDILISVTSFFRDPEAFDVLKAHLKSLISARADGSDLRVWVAGCATGEEAYSVLIVISECLEEMGRHLSVQMYATDIDIAALDTARAGVYPSNIAADVNPQRLRRYFNRQGDSHRIRTELRETVVFAPHNITKDPPFSKMDLVCCRNLLIYLESELQKRLLPLLHYALRAGGMLFLGPSETVGDFTNLFAVLDKKWKIYQRREVAVALDRVRFPAPPPQRQRLAAAEEAPEQLTAARLSDLSDKAFLDNYAPSFAVIDEKQRLVYVRGRTGKYLEISSGKPTLSILEMAREGLRTDLAAAIFRAGSERKEVTHEGVRIKANGGLQTVNLTVAPLMAKEIPPGLFMVVFQETGPVVEAGKPLAISGSRKRIRDLEEELKLTRDSLQATIEELGATNEELKSANEELQSNNEELQSTNEELDTSREELQSLNEELLTLNAELQAKNELLGKANDDLKNFLNRTDIAVIFLDEDLKIRSYTPAATDVLSLREIDVGRPVAEITSRLEYVGITDDAQEVLRTLASLEKEVQRKDGRWYKMRILPYLTVQNAISGVVVSFLDIDEQKSALRRVEQQAATAQESLEELQAVLDNAPFAVWTSHTPDCREITGNKFADQLLGVERRANISRSARPGEAAITYRIMRGGVEIGSRDLPVQRAAATGRVVPAEEMELVLGDGRQVHIILGAVPLFGGDGQVRGAVGIASDVTDHKRAELEVAHLASFPQLNPNPVVELSAAGAIIYANPAAGKYFPDLPERGPKHPFLAGWKAFAKAVAEGGQASLTREVVIGDSWWNQVAAYSPDTRTYRIYAMDITKRRKVEEELRSRGLEAEAVVKELEAFTYSVSHDLKAPLRTIEGFAQAISEDCGSQLDKKGQDYLTRVRSAGKNMDQLIEGLLRLSRLTQAEFYARRVDLSAIAAKVAERLQQAHPDRQVDVVIAPHLAVYGDSVLLETALQSLLDNAWKYTAERQRPRIEFGARDDSAQTVFYVKDNGIGFDSKYGDKLFTAFQRLHTPDEYPGIGIGLAAVRRIIHRHGGRVWAEGQPGKGATFYFTLDRHPAAQPEGKKGSPPADP